MRRALHIALAAAVCAAAPDAHAQFRSTPMVLYAPDHGADVLPYALSSLTVPPASDLLALYPDPTVSPLPFRNHRNMLTRLPSPVAQPSVLYDCVAAGSLAQPPDALTDVAYCVGKVALQIAFGSARGVLQSYTVQLNTRGAPRITFAHLLPRDADVIVVPRETGNGIDPGALDAVDFDATGIIQTRVVVTAVQQGRSPPQPEEVMTMRIGATARASGIDDLYLPGAASVQLFENRTQTGSPISFAATPILMKPQAGIPLADCEGAAPLDVDFDGVLDLVVSLSLPAPPYTPGGGHLYWIRGTAGRLDLFASGQWVDLGPQLGLVDPVVVRPLELGGRPAVAVWDRGLGQVLVIRSDLAQRELVVWRGETGGRHVRDIRLEDVVGSTAPDLVVDGTGFLESGHVPVSPAMLVYPDDGDASPVVAWAAGSPGTPLRGEDHPMAVVASDADGSFSVDWTIGDPWGVPAATGTPAYVLPGSTLCGTPPQQVAVTVRAIDAFGVYDEIGATLDVAYAPRIEIVGAVPPGRLVLPAGGAVAVVEGSAWTQCNVSLAWTSSPWPTGAVVVPDQGPGWIRQTVTLPETTYPDLLDGRPLVVELTATDPVLGPVLATLPLEIDATGLLDLSHESDLAAIGEGEVAMLETRIGSRLGVSLPSVHVVHALAGLVPAGEPQVSGAAIVETLRGGAEVVLDALPPSGAAVVVRVPVRTAGGRAASAVEVRSSGGHLLTPPAAAPVEAAPSPGCGCSSSPAGGALALAALAFRRRRPLT